MTERLPEGVHLGLDRPRYFEQAAMGSSDWIRLHFAKEGWWWGSRWNPDREPDKDTQATNYGTALHCILLEGVEAYERNFAVAPDKRDYVRLVQTIPEMKAALAAAGFSLSGTSSWKAEDWALECHSRIPDVPCWPIILADFAAESGDRATVSTAEDRLLRLMRHVATDPTRDDNAEVRRLFADDPDHPALCEVSVFAEVDGIWRRWRIDKMLPAADLDVKSLGNWRGRPLAYEIGETIARYGADIQRADYFDGRTTALRLVREGKVFGGTLEQRRYIERIAEEATPNPSWIWLYYQKPSNAGQAPVICPVWDDAWSETHNIGHQKLEGAKRFYRDAVAKYGLDRPWARVEPLHLTVESPSHPTIRFPHWIADGSEPAEVTAYEKDQTDE